MPIISKSFDLQFVEWRRVTDPNCKDIRVDFEYSLLGYDLPSGRLDMLLRYGKGGHCRRHRQVASTVTLVLEGEQFLKEMSPDGTTKSVHRKNRGIRRKLEQRNGLRGGTWRKRAHDSLSEPTNPCPKKRGTSGRWAPAFAGATGAIEF